MPEGPSAVFDATKPSSPLSIPAANTALLLMDYQNIVVPNIGHVATRVMVTAQHMRDWALSHSIPVYHCLIDTKPETKPIPVHKIADRWSWYEQILGADPELGKEVPELARTEDSELEKTFRRRPGFVSVLRSDGLGDELKRRDVRSLIVSGVSTSGCVTGTVRGATDEGYIVTVVKDACADPVTGMHDMLMEHALSATAHVATAQELQQAWGKSA